MPTLRVASERGKVSVPQTWLGRTQPSEQRWVSVLLRAGHEDGAWPVFPALFLKAVQTSPQRLLTFRSWDAKGTRLLHLLCFTGQSLTPWAKSSTFHQIFKAAPKVQVLQSAALLRQRAQRRWCMKAVHRSGVSGGAELALACGSNTNKQFGSLSPAAG